LAQVACSSSLKSPPRRPQSKQILQMAALGSGRGVPVLAEDLGKHCFLGFEDADVEELRAMVRHFHERAVLTSSQQKRIFEQLAGTAHILRSAEERIQQLASSEASAAAAARALAQELTEARSELHEASLAPARAPRAFGVVQDSAVGHSARLPSARSSVRVAVAAAQAGLVFEPKNETDDIVAVSSPELALRAKALPLGTVAHSDDAAANGALGLLPMPRRRRVGGDIGGGGDGCKAGREDVAHGTSAAQTLSLQEQLASSGALCGDGTSGLRASSRGGRLGASCRLGKGAKMRASWADAGPASLSASSAALVDRLYDECVSRSEGGQLKGAAAVRRVLLDISGETSEEPPELGALLRNLGSSLDATVTRAQFRSVITQAMALRQSQEIQRFSATVTSALGNTLKIIPESPAVFLGTASPSRLALTSKLAAGFTMELGPLPSLTLDISKLPCDTKKLAQSGVLEGHGNGGINGSTTAAEEWLAIQACLKRLRADIEPVHGSVLQALQCALASFTQCFAQETKSKLQAVHTSTGRLLEQRRRAIDEMSSQLEERDEELERRASECTGLAARLQMACNRALEAERAAAHAESDLAAAKAAALVIARAKDRPSARHHAWASGEAVPRSRVRGMQSSASLGATATSEGGLDRSLGATMASEVMYDDGDDDDDADDTEACRSGPPMQVEEALRRALQEIKVLQAEADAAVVERDAAEAGRSEVQRRFDALAQAYAEDAETFKVATAQRQRMSSSFRSTAAPGGGGLRPLSAAPGSLQDELEELASSAALQRAREAEVNLQAELEAAREELDQRREEQLLREESGAEVKLQAELEAVREELDQRREEQLLREESGAEVKLQAELEAVREELDQRREEQLLREESGAEVTLQAELEAAREELEQRREEQMLREEAEDEAAAAQAAHVQDRLDEMLQGAWFEKLAFRRQVRQPRFVRLTRDFQYLEWSAKEDCDFKRMPINAVLRVDYGDASRTYRALEFGRDAPPVSLCFSILTPSRSLDLIAQSERQVKVWMLGLNEVVPYRPERQRFTAQEFRLRRALLRLEDGEGDGEHELGAQQLGLGGAKSGTYSRARSADGSGGKRRAVRRLFSGQWR